MTQKEKIEMLKPAITFLYEKEGRSKNYISKLLEIDRVLLTKYINNTWELTEANSKRLKPSSKKFLNKNRQLIKSRLDKNVSPKSIAKELGANTNFLLKVISTDKVLLLALKSYEKRVI